MTLNHMHDAKLFHYTCNHDKCWGTSINQTFKWNLINFKNQMKGFIMIRFVDANPFDSRYGYGRWKFYLLIFYAY